MRLIDADALMEKINNSVFTADMTTTLAVGMACRWIDNAPTIDERKRGKWIDETFKPWGLVYHPYKCDQCGEYSEADSNYCPNCGAQMVGDSKYDT